MSIVSAIVARLEAITPPVFSIVAGAAEFASIDTVPTATPAAYVIVEQEQSAENPRATGPVLQQTAMDIAVIIIAGNVSDSTGAAAASDIEALKSKVRRALIGFEPDQEATPIEHISGELLKLRHGTVWHKELYGTTTYLEEEQ